ncbi:MAG: ABC transporter ATP-binding protein [Candidatus Glassbacteria bacterium]|nr:ABC transporter ATP-binding protein [Candidatus Glassbacteria bacterium]
MQAKLSEPIISARGLIKCFGPVRAVDCIDFEVYPGECFGMLGPNGAGKTSTMRMLYDFSPRTAGELSVFGLDPAGRDSVRVRQSIGVVPQADNLDLELTVRENLEVYGGYYGLHGRKLRERVERLLELMSLSDKARARIKQLSGGMKRRLTIVRALIGDPRLVVLDEPTTGLDPHARHQIWDLLRELTGSGVTIVLTTHYMDEAQRLCDRLVIMDQGKILCQGAPDELIHRHLPRLVLETGLQNLADGWGEQGIRFEQRGDQVLFLADSEADFRLLRFRDGGGRKIIRPANLEDLFLGLTGRGLDE